MGKTILWCITDHRYHTDPEHSSVLEACDSLEEAEEVRKEYWDEDCPIVQKEFEKE